MGQSYLGAGALYIDRLNADGTRNGLALVGNATKLEIKPDGEVKEQLSKGRGTYGQVIATAMLPKPTTITVDLNQLDKNVLAMAFMGDVSEINEAAGSVVDEAVTALSVGKYVSLAKRNLASTGFNVSKRDGVDALAREATTAYAVGHYAIPATPNGHYYRCTVAGTTGSTTPTYPTDGTTVADGTVTWADMGLIVMASGTDFDVHYRLGMLAPLDGGAILQGDVLLVDYTHNAVSGSRIKGATQPTIKARLVLDGQNYVDGKDNLVEIFEAQLKPTSSVDWLADDFSALTLEGTLVTPAGYDHPFRVDQLD
jgi:hypothetical protein